MGNPGAFRGSRKEFLMSQKPLYEAGVQGGHVLDALASIQRMYFNRYPVDLPHDEEPSAEHLAAVDDDVPSTEPDELDEAQYSADEWKEIVEAKRVREELIVYRKAQLKRWFAYQYMKDHDLSSKESGAQNPFTILLAQLTKTNTQRPRAKPAVNVWRRTTRKQIEEEVNAQATRLNVSKSRGLAALRERIVKEWYKKLPQEEQQEWERLAKEEHAAALEDWERELKAGPSTQPVDIQRAIESLIGFVEPILDGICKATGWKATLIAGGPEPARNGALKMLSIHSGTVSGDVKMNWGRSEFINYQRHVIPTFGSFLRKCYSMYHFH
ncbi:hypothetical protein CVT24_002862 [Panaeolus cyanescens]|uniref:Uncharacterized protein n=1 Tax=Panaeolus cyanescens TaxID=181874 RepID=A0A409YRK5_9AGAR|nr:hypothetical protein CVT24_002862 [Panaeolus cyanescens]